MISLTLISAFLLLAVIGRSFVQFKRNGDFGIRTAAKDAPWVEVMPGAIFVLTFCFAFGLILFGFLQGATFLYLPTFALQSLGFLIGMSGVVVTLISQFQMGDSWRIGVDQLETTPLIRHGIYARSRNPIYFGILLFWIGICITFPCILLWACALICWICIEVIVRKIEEPYLMKVHGNNYREYFASTNRYKP
ncbi:methyltransferase family protein [Glaciecola petra]|uniref:Isoprenylcysteine carboxylmethyltransferase family protein n=1 Tax=Glaciecola petra TaxID=3075602 RepID=A0ABU2ZS28_9ALTE|nr:isoprenylcysteine carboxylmethyltransferase family protein [Aestuariibacter sp. P117]MDT0595438.1 isoprenylcysteine carboxylmethyltransferase family protein [Aestuariibacter sp. P117]